MQTTTTIATRAMASFLITYYATNERLEGPYGMLDKFRAAMQVTQTTADIVACPFCFSFWAALLVAFLPERVQTMLASAGAVCLAFIAIKKGGGAADAFSEWLREDG